MGSSGAGDQASILLITSGRNWDPGAGCGARKSRRDRGADWMSLAWNRGSDCSSLIRDPNPKFAKCRGRKQRPQVRAGACRQEAGSVRSPGSATGRREVWCLSGAHPGPGRAPGGGHARGLPNGGRRHVGHQQRAGSALRGRSAPAPGIWALVAPGSRGERGDLRTDWRPPTCPEPPGAGSLWGLREDEVPHAGSPERRLTVTSSPVPLPGRGLLSRGRVQWEQGAEGVYAESVSQPPRPARWDKGHGTKRAAGAPLPEPASVGTRRPPASRGLGQAPWLSPLLRATPVTAQKEARLRDRGRRGVCHKQGERFSAFSAPQQLQEDPAGNRNTVETFCVAQAPLCSLLVPLITKPSVLRGRLSSASGQPWAPDQGGGSCQAVCPHSA